MASFLRIFSRLPATPSKLPQNIVLGCIWPARHTSQGMEWQVEGVIVLLAFDGPDWSFVFFVKFFFSNFSFCGSSKIQKSFAWILLRYLCEALSTPCIRAKCQELGARRLGITVLQAQRHELRGAELREAQQLQQERQRLQEEQRRLQQLNTQVGQGILRECWDGFFCWEWFNYTILIVLCSFRVLLQSRVCFQNTWAFSAAWARHRHGWK